jgi:hypothetical protein
MKKHTIELASLVEWQSEAKQLFASSTKGNKQIYATLRGSYEVWQNGVKILETMHTLTAVEKYNELETILKNESK